MTTRGILYIKHVPKTAIEGWSRGRKGAWAKARAGRRLFQFIKIVVPFTPHLLLKTNTTFFLYLPLSDEQPGGRKC